MLKAKVGRVFMCRQLVRIISSVAFKPTSFRLFLKRTLQTIIKQTIFLPYFLTVSTALVHSYSLVRSEQARRGKRMNKTASLKIHVPGGPLGNDVISPLSLSLIMLYRISVVCDGYTES